MTGQTDPAKSKTRRFNNGGRTVIAGLENIPARTLHPGSPPLLRRRQSHLPHTSQGYQSMASVCKRSTGSKTRYLNIHNLGDEYFVPTAAEAQRAFSGQVACREKLTDAPMLTKSLREREINQKKNEKLAPIRLKSDSFFRLVLGSSFPTALCSKARSPVHARSQTSTNLSRSRCAKTSRPNPSYSVAHIFLPAIPFFLANAHCPLVVGVDQTPPRREFLTSDPKTRACNLLDLQLAPSSLLLIKFADEIYNHFGFFFGCVGWMWREEESTNRPPLIPELLSAAQPLPCPPTFEPESSGKGTGNTLEKGKQKAEDLFKSGAKVPKWLQNLSSPSSSSPF
ncbi:hypothetical protein VP01_50g5 [Puccinia sorghi]|uniref:Uncharacterized protein n=1 Tax=Puccinia sorghi TaxID=27349 RepID=A0A0L6UL88_9BASI|nr:hypothetical protein VP01_50g5 [Puccinia sorghi]